MDLPLFFKGVAWMGLAWVLLAPEASLAGLTIEPSALGLYPGDSAMLRAVSTNPAGVTSVAWTAQCGQLGSAPTVTFKGDQRVYTAPTSAGGCNVGVTTVNSNGKAEFTESAHLVVAVDPSLYLSVSTSAASAEAGGQVDVDIDLNPPPGVMDAANLFTSGGSLTPVLSLTGETTWVWTAPAEAGVYTVTAASTLHPDRTAVAQVVVAGEAHLNVPGGRTVVMERPGDTIALDAELIGADGLPVKGGSVQYLLLEGEGIELSPDGVVTSLGEMGFGTVGISAEGVASQTVSVLLGDLHPNARIIDQRWLRYASPSQVVFDLNAETGAVSAGDVVLTGEQGGVLARVLSRQVSGGALILGVEEASLTDVFVELNAHLVGHTYVEQSSLQLGRGPEPQPPVTMDCESTDEQGVGVAVDLGLTKDINLTPHAQLVILPDQLPVLELYESGSVMVGLYEPNLEFSEGVTVGAECFVKFAPLPGASIPLGPALVGFTHTFSVGASVEATVGGTLKIIGPNVRTRVEDIKMGVAFNGIVWAPLREYTVAETFSGYEGADPFKASLGFSAEAQIYASVVTGIGVSPGGKPLAYLDFLDNRGYGYLSVSEDLPFDWHQPSYRGPVPELGVGTSADFGPFFESPMIKALFRLVGVEDLLNIDVSLYDHQWPLLELEEVTLTSQHDGGNPPQSVALTAAATDWQSSCVVHFESFDPQAPEIPTGLLASATLDDVGRATVTVGWPAQRTEVLALVYQAPFTLGERPYGSNRVVIGGTPCDGPECQNTIPAGGPSQTPGVGGGGGFGDPDDNGDPDQSGSVGGPGGGPWQMDGGLGGGWPGNPEGSGGSTADPHLVSFDGLRFNMQAPGEYILSWGLDEDLALDPLAEFGVQVRQTPVTQLASGAPGAVNSAVGVRMGDHDVAIYAVEGATPMLVVDGQPHAAQVGEVLELGVGHLLTQSGGFLFVWDSGTWVRVRVGWAHLDITTSLSPEQAGGVVGLLGDYDGDPENDFALRDGSTLARPINHHQLYDLLAPAWRVGEGDPHLLDPTMGTPVPDLPDFPGLFGAAQVNLEEWLDARDRCQAGGVYFVGVLEACTWDVAILLHGAAPLEQIQSIISSHVLSQHDLFGQGEVEAYINLVPVTLRQGESLSLGGVIIGDGSQLSWEASCGEITPQGRGALYVAPLQAGTCTVAVYHGGALIDQAEVTVMEVSLTVNPMEAEIFVGDELSLEATLTGLMADEVGWSTNGGALSPFDRWATFSADQPGIYTVRVHSTARPGLEEEILIDVKTSTCLQGWGASSTHWSVNNTPCSAGLGVQGTPTPTWMVSPWGQSYIDVEVRGTVTTHSNSSGAQIGLIAGFDPEGSVTCVDPRACDLHMVVFDWWQAWLPSEQKEAWISRVDGVVDLTNTSLWGNHAVVPGSAYKPLVGLDTNPWPRNAVLTWRVVYRPDRIQVTIWHGATQLLDMSALAAQVLPAGESFQPGRVGFFERAEHGDTFTLDSITYLE